MKVGKNNFINYNTAAGEDDPDVQRRLHRRVHHHPCPTCGYRQGKLTVCIPYTIQCYIQQSTQVEYTGKYWISAIPSVGFQNPELQTSFK